MWPKNYKDKPPDTPLKKNRIESGKGIVGCEMHEINGWGTSYHLPKKKKGFFRKLLSKLSKKE